MSNVIALINQKGGVSKTTSTLNIGYFLSLKSKVLLIDFDPQRDLTKSFGNDESEYSIIDLLNKKSFEPSNVRGNLDLVVGSRELEAYKLRKTSFKDVIEPIKKNYDYILIDCQPKMIIDEILTINEVILNGTDFILIPLLADINTVNGAFEFLNSIERIQNTSNPNLKVLGMFFNRISKRNVLYKQLYNHLISLNEDMILKRTIRQGEAIPQAIAMKKAIGEFAPSSLSNLDYNLLTTEIITKLNTFK